MFSQVIKSILSQAKARPALSLLNLVGLAGGIATAILISFYVYTELNFDSWVKERDNLYRVEGQFVASSSGGYATSSMGPLKAEIDATIEEVELSSRLLQFQMPVKRRDFVNFEQLVFVDPEFLDLFSLNFIKGAQETALKNPNDLIISQKMAIKYFGSTDPMGQLLILNGDQEYTVKAVIEDLPNQTDFQLDFIMLTNDKIHRPLTSWNSIFMGTYIRVKEGVPTSVIDKSLYDIVEKHRPFIGDGPDVMSEVFRLFIQPFDQLHLGSRGRTAGNSIGNYATIYGFAAIAFLVLVISTFNYVSLAMARALEREKEICLRKVHGASHKRIINQIMAESITQTFLSALIGLAIACAALPSFNAVLDQDYSVLELLQPQMIAVLLGGIVILGLIAGIYPAFFIAGFRPVRFLSGGKTARRGLNRLRTALVFIQFTVSIALLIGAVTVSLQMDYISKLDLGFDGDKLLVVRGIDRSETQQHSDSFKARIANISGVEALTRSNIVPTDGNTHMEGLYSKLIERDEGPGLRIIAIDSDFFGTYSSTLIAGRAFDDKYANDKGVINLTGTEDNPEELPNVIVDDVAVRELGYSDAASIIDQEIYLAQEGGKHQKLIVVGVVKSLQFRSARSETNAKLFIFEPDMFRALSVRVRPEDLKFVQDDIERTWREMYVDIPLRTDFLAERIDGMYRTENQQLDLFLVFSGLTFVLSLVGLVGMVLNSVKHRTKEISIRRVVGASVRDILRLFLWDYLKPVLVANIPAWALAYYFLDDWLQKYPSRIDLDATLFAFGGAGILVITMVMVFVLVNRTALTPPSHALRYE